MRFSLSMTNLYASRSCTDTSSNGSWVAGIFCFAFPTYSGCHHALYTKKFSSVTTPQWGSSRSVVQGPRFEDFPRKPCLIPLNNMIRDCSSTCVFGCLVFVKMTCIFGWRTKRVIANRWCKVTQHWRMHNEKCITSCNEQSLAVRSVWAMSSRILCWKSTRVCNKT